MPRPSNFRLIRPKQAHTAARPPLTADSITWTREVTPRERYRIAYVDRDGQLSSREIDLLRLGHFETLPYCGVMHLGRFKTLRLDRITAVETLSQGHEPSLREYPTYRTTLPQFPKEDARYRVPTIRGQRTWAVDLNAYTCACPERRERLARGYTPGQLGFCCLHLARAILDHLPPNSPGWTPELLAFLTDRRNLHLDHLS